MFRRINILLALLLIISGLFSPAQAAPDAPNVVGDGTSASCTEAALTNALAVGGTITFNCGGGKTITFTGEKSITQDTVIEGANAIYFSGGSTTRLFKVLAPASLTLNDIQLKDTYSANADGGAIWSSGALVLNHVIIENSAAGVGTCGGAIWTSGAAIISNSRLEHDSAVVGGGAICTASSGSPTLQITDSRIQYNGVAQGGDNIGYGGAIYLGSTSTLTATDNFFADNKAQFGGALAIMPGATATIHENLGIANPTFRSNGATHSGGAVYNLGTLNVDEAQFGYNYILPGLTPNVNGYGAGLASFGYLTMRNSFFYFNEGRIGGGIYLAGGLDSSRADIQRVEFSRNKAKVAGGGIFADTTTFTVTNSTFAYNQAAGSGGGLGCAACTRLQLLNSSFITNTANYGGGLYVSAGSESQYAKVRNVTFSGNQSLTSRGGAVYNQGNLELYFATIAHNGNGVHSVVNANTRLRGTVLYNPGYVECGKEGNPQYSNDGGNHISDDSCSPQFPAKGNPQLGPFQWDRQEKYWETYYYLPLPGSPLINSAFNCPETDQRGATRRDACDIGAVEFGGMLARLYVPAILH